MNNEQPIDSGNTEFVLPIVCTHCGKEIDLAMVFKLLPPEEVVPTPLEKKIQKIVDKKDSEDDEEDITEEDNS